MSLKWAYALNGMHEAEQKRLAGIKERAEAFFQHVHVFLKEQVAQGRGKRDDRSQAERYYMKANDIGISQSAYAMIKDEFASILEVAYEGLWGVYLKRSYYELVFSRYDSLERKRQECGQEGGLLV